MRTTVLLLPFVAGCYLSHVVDDDASTDAWVDAPVALDSGVPCTARLVTLTHVGECQDVSIPPGEICSGTAHGAYLFVRNTSGAHTVLDMEFGSTQRHSDIQAISSSACATCVPTLSELTNGITHDGPGSPDGDLYLLAVEPPSAMTASVCARMAP